jgi:hypothetical protein
MESAATLDVLVRVGACETAQVGPGKTILLRVVSMLSRMTEASGDAVREDESPYGMHEAEIRQ